MGLFTTIRYGAFAICKKKVTEIEKTIGKKCLNEHSFSHDDEMQFCPKCGLTLLDDKVIATELVPDAWEVEEKLPDSVMRHVFLNGDHDLFIDHKSHEGLKTQYLEKHERNRGVFYSGIDLHESAYYVVGDPDTYIKNFKEKFSEHIKVLEANYESVEIKCGVVVEHD